MYLISNIQQLYQLFDQSKKWMLFIIDIFGEYNYMWVWVFYFFF